jgi:predicted AlkP superfamily phosphohydrolase/phosphomutase
MTLPAWTSFLTGTPPATHGLPDFTLRQGYHVRFVGAQVRTVPTLLSHLEQQGQRVGAAWFPATYPPERLRGYQLSGWDSPVTAQGDSSFLWPRSLHAELTKRFGVEHLRFDSIDEFRDHPQWYEQAITALVASIRRRTEMACWLLRHHPTDVAAFYFGEADTAAHHLWAFHDEASPRRPANVDPVLQQGLGQVYAALDEAVERLVDEVGEAASVVVLSDHGSGGSSDVALHLNRLLARAGLLKFAPAASLAPSLWRGSLPSLLPPRWRRRVFRFARGWLPALVESRLRFGGIDWQGTKVFSEELGYAPSLWFNLRGREPQGQVDPAERHALTQTLASLAAEVRGPQGEPLIKSVIPRADIPSHRGLWAHRFPDLTIELHRPGGYTPVCLPSEGQPGPVVEQLRGSALLGRKGRSLPGGHVPEGILLVAGPSVEPGPAEDAELHDVASMVAALAGVPGAPWFEGRPRRGLPFAQPLADELPLPPAGGAGPYNALEERVVAERLRRLGYLE